MKMIKGLFLILMMDCEQSARLTSESFDRSLSRSEVWALKIHQFCCRSSYRVARQMEMVTRSLKDLPESSQLQITNDNLPDEARERIRKQLKDISE